MFASLRFISPVQHRLSNQNKEEADSGRRQEMCTAVGEGRAWMLRQLLECGGSRKGKEGMGIGQGLPTTQGGVSSRLEEHMAAGH